MISKIERKRDVKRRTLELDAENQLRKRLREIDVNYEAQKIRREKQREEQKVQLRADFLSSVSLIEHKDTVAMVYNSACLRLMEPPCRRLIKQLGAGMNEHLDFNLFFFPSLYTWL